MGFAFLKLPQGFIIHTKKAWTASCTSHFSGQGSGLWTDYQALGISLSHDFLHNTRSQVLCPCISQGMLEQWPCFRPRGQVFPLGDGRFLSHNRESTHLETLKLLWVGDIGLEEQQFRSLPLKINSEQVPYSQENQYRSL